MSRVARDAWHCDVCGHEWLVNGEEPKQCTSGKCRSRKWNGGEGCRAEPRLKTSRSEPSGGSRKRRTIGSTDIERGRVEKVDAAPVSKPTGSSGKLGLCPHGRDTGACLECDWLRRNENAK
jgi:hypothetical protein